MNDMEAVAEEIKQLRQAAFCAEAIEGLSPEAEQYALLMLSALDQAERFARLALYKERRENAAALWGVR